MDDVTDAVIVGIFKFLGNHLDPLDPETKKLLNVPGLDETVQSYHHTY